MRSYESWGRYPSVEQRVVRLDWASDDPLGVAGGRPVLPYGRGRSYGDCCLNAGGVLLATERLDRFAAFDAARGVLACEAGVTLGDILALAVPRGWSLPVVPGTKHVSVGGAIANDVHGKNHHRAGTFGRHVRAFELARDGGRLLCTPEENAELFRATIGGLGLTGVVVRAELQLRRVAGPWIDAEAVPFGGLDEFFQLSAESDPRFEYTVAWVDALARRGRLGRGILHRGNHAEDPGPPAGARAARIAVPFDLPGFALNRWTVGAFNELYYRTQRRAGRRRTHQDPFFFPLDGVRDWNRVYGRAGLLQFQCVLPPAARAATRELLEVAAESRQASFLAVLKVFGDLPSPGLLSFPRPGATLALDFPNRGEATFALLERLAAVVRAAGGAFYPAKDARMSRADMAASYPRLAEFRRHVSPSFSSSLWRRVADGGDP